MSFSLSIYLSTFEDLDCYVHDVNKFKIWKSKQGKKRKTNTPRP